MNEAIAASDERMGLPSASSLHRLVECPGSWALESRIPPEPSSDAALEGTMLHSVIEGAHPHGDLTPDQQWAIDRYRDLETEVFTKLGYNDFADAPELFREQRLWYRDAGNVALYSGQADTVAVHLGRDEACVIDAKFGRIPVRGAESNIQLRALAVLVARHYEVRRVFVVVVQPRIKDAVTVCRYDYDALVTAEEEIQRAIRESAVTGAPRIPSESACRYCRAKSLCPEARGEALSVVSADDLARGYVELPVLTGDEFATILPKVELAKQIIKGLEAQAKQFIESGGTIPGYALKASSPKREIPDAQKAYNCIADAVTAEEYAAICGVSISKLEVLYGEKTGLIGRTLKEALAERLGDAVQLKSAAPSLVRTT